MRQLCMLLCVLLIVTLTASVGAIAVGRQQPALTHAQTREFEVCGAQPCFWDIVPGVTALDAAGSRVREFSTMEARRGRMPFTLSWLDVRGNLYWDEQSRVVTGIGLAKRHPTSSSSLPMLLELILLYGEPCAVQPYTLSVVLIFLHVWGISRVKASISPSPAVQKRSCTKTSAAIYVSHPMSRRIRGSDGRG